MGEVQGLGRNNEECFILEREGVNQAGSLPWGHAVCSALPIEVLFTSTIGKQSIPG